MNGHANGHFNGHDANGNGKLDNQLPEEEMFHILRSTGTAATGTAARLGRLALPRRRILETPHYLANTSRGVVPHITQDTFVRDTDINGVYVALEDFIEKGPKDVPPIYKFRSPDGASPLRRFIAAPDDGLLVLGARRASPVAAPEATSNTNKTVSICTAVGFRALKADDYAEKAESLRADILVGLGDIPYERALGSKRIEKATDRNISWLEEHVFMRRSEDMSARAKLFASLLPVSCAKQQYYVDELVGQFADHISGLALYDLDTVEDLPEQLDHLPRLSFASPKTPRDVLYQIRLGLDIFVIPFVGAATDAGIALDFTFGNPSPGTTNGDEHLDVRRQQPEPLPLGIDMWSEEHAIDLSPLAHGCQCYACTNHHRAYLQHLLAAKEMLGWVLLQIHNHHVMDLFFASIRQSIASGTLDRDINSFEQKYDSLLPAKTGQGPRIRGYQFKSEGPGEVKKNSKSHLPFKMLDDGQEKLAEATLPDPQVNAEELQAQGFAEKES
ncbi:Putative tRNA-guanine(15) transglycosylase, queuine tRNA-ribosyltransferase accessory subunit QTRTD1 [Septoria linicola]|uniref:Queuine tRNA-ribosyltransferase accessory subunit 2 n=1 Tax=Septoria linicola TaxID=215465 RepID=A0A9Q9EIT1_9PEZI|nr:putative tRNA-guanine(15) transglycosylase, queuine tRNA-ribosyltransferase accessory subunit QTRTD1 [Septoria linicola]USW51434.1 Putative tRNA-guanine(15) transglycosylase, queuine tRNA-ribosyltransferase accessory subunit QTRTD1 [Septoria linicola]